MLHSILCTDSCGYPSVCAVGECAVDISNGKFTWEVPERPALTE